MSALGLVNLLDIGPIDVQTDEYSNWGFGAYSLNISRTNQFLTLVSRVLTNVF